MLAASFSRASPHAARTVGRRVHQPEAAAEHQPATKCLIDRTVYCSVRAVRVARVARDLPNYTRCGGVSIYLANAWPPRCAAWPMGELNPRSTTYMVKGGGISDFGGG